MLQNKIVRIASNNVLKCLKAMSQSRVKLLSSATSWYSSNVSVSNYQDGNSVYWELSSGKLTITTHIKRMLAHSQMQTFALGLDKFGFEGLVTVLSAISQVCHKCLVKSDVNSTFFEILAVSVDCKFSNLPTTYPHLTQTFAKMIR